MDFAISLFNVVEFSVLNGVSGINAIRAIRVFRIFRIIRITRIFRYIQSMNIIIQVISNSLSRFMYLAMLLFLFIIIFALLGMQIFGG